TYSILIQLKSQQAAYIYIFHFCCQTADCAADGDIVMVSAHWEKRRTALIQLLEQLKSLPAFVSELDAITANIAHLEGDFEEMESRLVYLETLCSQCEQQTVKQHHINQLEVYKKQKRYEVILLVNFIFELNSEHAHKVAELEQAMQQKLKERQKVYEEAFIQDMEQYRSTGYLQHAGRLLASKDGSPLIISTLMFVSLTIRVHVLKT
uniref:Dysbindin n=1 Tax=Amphiprion ocellaris TaxID=80972 RepID=A0AAQ6A712_AMPOC